MDHRNGLARCWVLLGWLLIGTVPCCGAVPALVNGGFEQALPDGSPAGWTVLCKLDPHGYGPPEYRNRFDAIRPVCAPGGRLSPRCLAFPAKGTWMCPVFMHSNGDGAGIDGKRLGKAAVFQTIDLPAGRYRFTAWLRTADGDFYSTAFSLGVNLGPPARYANDGATGIRWTRSDLAMRRSRLRGPSERGDWARYSTEPFELPRPGPVTVWIRLNYINENQMRARWQVDDAAIVAVTEPSASGPARHAPCPPPPDPVRWRVFCGDLEPYLVDPGDSTIVPAPEVRLFRHARLVPAGRAVRFRFPASLRNGALSLLVSAAGRAEVQVAGRRFQAGGADAQRPVVREWLLPADAQGSDALEVVIRASQKQPVRLCEIELARPSRTVIRLQHVEADVVAVPWVIGSWDGSAREFAGTGERVSIEADATPPPTPLRPSGRWTIRFAHAPVDGHRYTFVYGLIRGECSIDVGGDGLIEWVAQTKGEEIVDVDVTERLTTGANTIVVDSSGQHDFAALLEICPGSSDPTKWRVAFEGDKTASLLTRVMANTWFWLRELHYEPTGFVDASVPHGRWYNQYWPIDIAFALREWVRWGYHDQSARIGRFVARWRWHGHSSNRSGGSDNTAGNILVRELCEILRRADLDPKLVGDLWPAVRDYAAEVITNAEASKFGLVRGTNWENAGNREHGPCYALTTTLGAAATLRKAAALARRIDKDAEAAEQWAQAAERLRQAVLKHLVLRQDHRCPSGFVLPAGTWAYGLRTDGTIEDQPLAGYFWAGGAPADVDGLCPTDAELLGLYDRTLQAALPLVTTGRRGIVSGYAASYDGSAALLVTAALCDRINAFDALLAKMVQHETDAERDVGTRYAELSRWAYGSAGGSEDTNLVGAAGLLWALRTLVGIDDLLSGGRQLTLVPRLPWKWHRLTVHDWPVRYRDADGRPKWTKLSFRLQRDERSARVQLRSSEPAQAVPVRLGPFPAAATSFSATRDGQPCPVRTERSGDAAWGWVRCDLGPKPTTVHLTVRP